jgi:hypothetical protein
LEEGATIPFAGGLAQHGYQCGMIWGAALAAGAEAHRRLGSGPETEAAAIRAARRIVETFRTRHNEINCFEITEIDKSSSTWDMISYFLLKGGTVGCFRMAAWFAPLAFDEIDAALSPAGEESPSPPVSCAALLAQRMGASDLHTVMVSGLAGGIGLCGGACGALGAAIWLKGMKTGKETGKKVGFGDPRTQKVIDGFMRHTDFEFECAAITGRDFDNVGDHAEYLNQGGCAEVIEFLAGS